MAASPSRHRRLAILRALGRALGVACYATGSVFRSRTLRAMGLPSVAERKFRRGDFEAARARALQLLRLAEVEPSEWNYGNAVHKAHLMLGRVALARGDVASAEAALLDSARVPGSPQLASFGPNMQLALDLLQAGRKEVVLEYFHLCEAFWEMGRPQLRSWTRDVEQDRLPFFGGNLLY
jgi:hypothetical protein